MQRRNGSTTSRSRSSANDLAIRRRCSRWPSTNTCSPACNATPPTPRPAHDDCRSRRPGNMMSVGGTVATRHAKRPWSDMKSDQGLWWRGQNLNLRPSGYESSDVRARRSALARVRPGRHRNRVAHAVTSSAPVGGRLFEWCSHRVRASRAERATRHRRRRARPRCLRRIRTT